MCSKKIDLKNKNKRHARAMIQPKNKKKTFNYPKWSCYCGPQ